MINTSKDYSLKTILIVSIPIIVFSLVSYFHFDKPIAIYFHDFRIPALFDFGQLLSSVGEFPICLLLPFAVFFVLPFRNKFDWKNYLFLFVCFFITSSICWTLKVFLGRYRPEAFFSDNLYGFTLSSTKDHTQHSMPSGHSSVVATFMTALALIEPRFAWLFYSLSVILSFARIIVGAHYISDVLMSWLIGFFVAILVHKAKFFSYANKLGDFVGNFLIKFSSKN